MKILRFATLIVAVSIIILLRNHNYLIPVVVVFIVLVMLIQYLFLQINIWRKKYFCIGLKRFYLAALIHELLVSVVVFGLTINGTHRIIPIQISDVYICMLYLLIIALLDLRKHIFLITQHHLIHKHGYKTIQWKLNSLRKVYIYPHKIEFVKGHSKLKATFDDPSDSPDSIIKFIEPLIGKKLRVKDDSRFDNFE